MVYRIALSISLLAFPFGLRAQTADDYFHGGAQSYIQAEKEKARQEVFTGLQKFPTDPKLNGMAGLLKKQEEEKQKQQQQQQQDQQKDQSKEQQKQDSQSQKKDSEQKQDSSEQKQESKSEQEKKQQEAKQEQQKKEQQEKQEKEQQQAQQNSGKPEDKSEEKDGEKTYTVGQMTPEQAQQLLDTQKNEEKLLPLKPTGKPVDRSRPLRDW